MDYLGFLYAFTVLLGGTIGYIKAGSTASLISGVTFGSLLAYAAKRVSNNPKDVRLALGLSALLLVVMGMRYTKSYKFMPAGLVATLSFIMTVRYGYVLYN